MEKRKEKSCTAVVDSGKPYEVTMDTPLEIKTTFEQAEDARRLARLLLEKRLVACAQIQGPMQSLYWWQGVVAEESEFLLTMKTLSSLLEEVEQTIGREHPYEVPELVALPIGHVGRDYLDWLHRELQR